jgi:NAD(P) transhydrogenase
MDRLRARVRDVFATMTSAVAENLNRHGVELVRGDARLGPRRTVTVHDEDGGERVLRARVVLLATGSRPHHPPSIPFDDPDVHDAETVLSIERPPERVVAIGGGPVGCSTPRSSPPWACRSRSWTAAHDCYR